LTKSTKQISGHPSWGIAWYINDLLIPEIYVERGSTYTFIVEGGKKKNLKLKIPSTKGLNDS
jgi:hypothetical protein